MYSQFEPGDTITIFCEGKRNDDTNQTPNSRKRKRADSSVSVNDHEEEVKRVAKELNDKHGERWNQKQYLLWACKQSVV